MFEYHEPRGFTLFEIVALTLIMGIVFAFGTPKYIKIIHDTHNSNIDRMVGIVKIWSAEQAIENLHESGNYVYPLPNNAKIINVIKEGKLGKWDDSDPSNWSYVAGGGIQISGDGSYFDVRPVYIN